MPGARPAAGSRRASYTDPVEADPFSVLGLPARPEVGDDEVRAAWRRIAAATHPDRADGGDPARFAAAAAAYTTLRTRSGRGEALADLARAAHGRACLVPASRAGGGRFWAWHAYRPGSGTGGRPGWR